MNCTLNDVKDLDLALAFCAFGVLALAAFVLCLAAYDLIVRLGRG